MGDLVHNERVKYTATFWNNLSVTAVGAGLIIPLFSFEEKLAIYGYFFMAVGAALGAIFRLISNFTLRRLKE
jgi:hypothetical protein